MPACVVILTCELEFSPKQLFVRHENIQKDSIKNVLIIINTTINRPPRALPYRDLKNRSARSRHCTDKRSFADTRRGLRSYVSTL